MQDFTLAPIVYLEETSGPAIELMIEGYTFILPASWNILISDDESSMIDSIPLSACSKNNYKALLMSATDSKMRLGDIRIIDLHSKHPVVHPMLEKGTMHCHPVGPSTNGNPENILSAQVGPHDLSSKYLQDTTIADLLY